MFLSIQAQTISHLPSCRRETSPSDIADLTNYLNDLVQGADDGLEAGLVGAAQAALGALGAFPKTRAMAGAAEHRGAEPEGAFTTSDHHYNWPDPNRNTRIRPTGWRSARVRFLFRPCQNLL
jgi:hypothetical protein